MLPAATPADVNPAADNPAAAPPATPAPIPAPCNAYILIYFYTSMLIFSFCSLSVTTFEQSFIV